MEQSVVGTYEPGTFLMKYYLKNVPYEISLYLPFFVGDEKSTDIYGQVLGSKMATERILTYMHECNHYLHDLSLSSCIAEDYLRDEISFWVKAVSDNYSGIRYPLLSGDTRQHNQNIIPAKWFEGITNRFYLKDFLFTTFHTSSDSSKYSFLFDENLLRYTRGKGLSTTELLEGYVHYKSVNDLVGRATITGKHEYIRQFKNDYNLYPYSYDETNAAIDIAGIYDETKYTYHIARVIYMCALSEFDWKSAFSYLNAGWPHGYADENNMWSILDCGFFLLLDIALTIPPIAYITRFMEEGDYCIEDFSPVHRFLLALHIIKENKRFPDAKEGEPFYVTLFNMIARHPSAGWLDFENTTGCWEMFFNQMKEVTGDTSAGYRHRVFRHKFTKFHKFFLNLPSEQLQQTAVPFMSLVRGGGLKIMRRLGYHNIPYEGLVDAYELYKMPFVQWKEEGITDEKELMRQEIRHSESLMRETVYRIIDHNISESLLFRDSFTCAFYHEEYFAAKKRGDGYNSQLPPHLFCRAMDKCRCCKVKDLQSLPLNGCAVREYMIGTKYKLSQIRW